MPEKEEMIKELRQQKVQELKEAVYVVVLRQQKAAFSADLNKAWRER